MIGVIDNQFNLKIMTMAGDYSMVEMRMYKDINKRQVEALERAIRDADMREVEHVQYATELVGQIEALEQVACAIQLQIRSMNHDIDCITIKQMEYLIAEAMKSKDAEIATLKQRIDVLEKIVNPMPDYDYNEYANRIAPFKQELIIAGRMMSKMHLGRSRLPVATIVTKQ